MLASPRAALCVAGKSVQFSSSLADMSSAQQKEKDPAGQTFPTVLDAGLVKAGSSGLWHVRRPGFVLRAACVNTHGMSPVGLAFTRHPPAAALSGRARGRLDNTQAHS